jgi:hypothetical protein
MEFEFNLPDKFLVKSVEKPTDKSVDPIVDPPKSTDLPKPADPPLVDPPKQPDVIPLANIFDDVLKPLDNNELVNTDPILQIVKDLELTLPEGVDKWEASLIVNKTKEKIEANKAKLDLSAFDPDVRMLHEFLQENGGSLTTLMIDPTIRGLHELTTYDPQFFFEIDQAARLEVEGFDKEEVEAMIANKIAKIPEEQRPAYFENYQNDKIAKDVTPRINARIKEMNADKLAYREKLQNAAQTDQGKVTESMIKTIEGMEKFVGLELSQKNKEVIVSKIKSGDIQKEIAKDPGSYQVLGYLFKIMEPSATEVLNDIIEKKGNSKYSSGVRSILDMTHNQEKKDESQQQVIRTAADWAGLKDFIKK